LFGPAGRWRRNFRQNSRPLARAGLQAVGGLVGRRPPFGRPRKRVGKEWHGRTGGGFVLDFSGPRSNHFSWMGTIYAVRARGAAGGAGNAVEGARAGVGWRWRQADSSRRMAQSISVTGTNSTRNGGDVRGGGSSRHDSGRPTAGYGAGDRGCGRWPVIPTCARQGRCGTAGDWTQDGTAARQK